MKPTTRKMGKQSRRTGKRDVRISFLNRNPRAQPSISPAQARQLVKRIQGIKINGRKGVELAACTSDSCGRVVQRVKSIYGSLTSSTLGCKYTCKWFYSKAGGWQKECYFKCSDGGLTIEGTG